MLTKMEVQSFTAAGYQALTETAPKMTFHFIETREKLLSKKMEERTAGNEGMEQTLPELSLFLGMCYSISDTIKTNSGKPSLRWLQSTKYLLERHLPLSQKAISLKQMGITSMQLYFEYNRSFLCCWDFKF